jgi:hypothetical protein
MFDPSAWAKLLDAGTAFVTAVGKLFGQSTPTAPTEAELLNQRQEQAAGAARNYSSRRTELAERAQRSASNREE